MQVGAGLVCDWFVSPDFLIKALREIEAENSGARLLCVVDDRTGTTKNGFIVYYKNDFAAPAKKDEGEPK